MTNRTHLELPEAFAALGLDNAILLALAEINFREPSEIQKRLIPVALRGVDVIGQARTGTGKTAAFGLPILQRMDPGQAFQTLVVVPTRELAVQVEAELLRFARHTALRLQVVYGGQKVTHDLKLLERQPHLVVGTPGRIIDLNERGALPLHNMKFVVCDEVDRMFDIGFRDDVRKILTACVAPHQTILVSATINDDIERLVAKHTIRPERIFTSTNQETLTNPEAIQYFVGVQPWDKQRALHLLLKQENPKLAIIFCRTKRSVDKVAGSLSAHGINASPIHGDLLQAKRERVMRGFRTGKINVLVATDLASRGIDVHEITHIINYDVPEEAEVYVHRVGRTARMGATGRAFTFVSPGQAQLQTEIEKLINHLLEDYKISGFVPSPEPGRSHGFDKHRSSAGSVSPVDPQDADAHSAARAAPSAASAADTTVYSPTSFAAPSVESKPRPLSGRFPTRRRR